LRQQERVEGSKKIEEEEEEESKRLMKDHCNLQEEV